MRNYFVLILLVSSIFKTTPILSITSEFKLYINKNNPLKLLNEDGNILYNSSISDSLILNGESRPSGFGISVSSAGDLNGDGYSDIIVGAYLFSSNKGRVYIYYGGPLMDNIADLSITGDNTSSSFGRSVSTAGDVNGDGYSDVIIGAYLFDNNTGKSLIFYGGSSMDTIPDVILTGESSFDEFGVSVSTAGDVNSDGYSDVIVGAYQSISFTGTAYIFYGGVNMNNIADVKLSGESSNNGFGYSVSLAGDVNHDGYSDVVIGAYGYNSNRGRAYIFYGGSLMNNIADVFLNGVSSENYFGLSVSGAGDVNKDGYSDVIIGAPQLSLSTGYAIIFYGGSNMNNIADVTMTGESTDHRFGISVSDAGDVNKDGYSDVIIGANGYDSYKGRAYIFYGGSYMDNFVDFLKNGEPSSEFGISVSSAGDINGDDCPDLIVGAYSYNFVTGRAYIYFNLNPKPELISPLNSSSFNPTLINFQWKRLKSAIYYILIVSTDSSFNNKIVNDTLLVDTSTIVNGLIKNKKYFWKVNAKDSSGSISYSSVWNFTTIPPIYLNLKVLMEGMYYQFFNQMIRKDTVNVYLRNATSPYAVVDSAKGIIDSLSFSYIFSFINAPSGTYYIVVKHFNSIETWSKTGGESITIDGTIYSYDFTTSASKAYGNNQKLKGSKYCIYGGNVNGDAIVDASDLSDVDNDSYAGLSGRYLRSDVNGDGFVDASDITIVDNNRSMVISRPYF